MLKNIIIATGQQQSTSNTPTPAKSMYLIPTDEYEVGKLIRKLKPNRSVGCDNIAKLLKIFSPYIKKTSLRNFQNVSRKVFFPTP